jgi:hypothetical protein
MPGRLMATAEEAVKSGIENVRKLIEKLRSHW